MPTYYFRGLPAIRDRSEARRRVNAVRGSANRKACDVAVEMLRGEPEAPLANRGHDTLYGCPWYGVDRAEVDRILSAVGYPDTGAPRYGVEYTAEEQAFIDLGVGVAEQARLAYREARQDSYRRAREDALRDAPVLRIRAAEDILREYESQIEGLSWGGHDDELTIEGIYQMEYWRALRGLAPSVAAAAERTSAYRARREWRIAKLQDR